MMKSLTEPAALQHIVNGELPQDVAMQALMAAVEKGVQCEDGVYRFFDPGIPLVTLRSLPMIRQKKFVYAHNWFDRYDWAKRQDAPQERTLRIPVEGSFKKTFADQKKLLTADEEVASTRSVAILLVIVGSFDDYGLRVDHYWVDVCAQGIAVAAARKS